MQITINPIITGLIITSILSMFMFVILLYILIHPNRSGFSFIKGLFFVLAISAPIPTLIGISIKSSIYQQRNTQQIKAAAKLVDQKKTQQQATFIKLKHEINQPRQYCRTQIIYYQQQKALIDATNHLNQLKTKSTNSVIPIPIPFNLTGR